ncbi:NAD kinase [Zoogloeaceae bacteirum Par-f-2]|uniref:NAD kinase n=1 Tax=Pseudothauera hydrothermalis TaxID=2184083 RepID=UPI000D256376|nr:NAD kinase [Pseudothauera hydrothermalis]AVZ78739.1 NAD kinase [Zoogloeaceae bacteirum Par-f-2]
MSQRFHTVALIGKYQSPDVAEAVSRLAEFLRGRGLRVLIEQGTASSIGMGGGEFPPAAYDEIGARADLAVVLGGDGTMLNTARRLAEHGVPLVGINQGRLGFLTDIAREDASERIGEILDGRYISECRFMLDAEILRGGQRIFHTLALNDVVINKGDLGRMIEFDVTIDGEFVYTQRSDGMIVSTPTGSTAYALSANGPILHPSVGGIAIVPLCPHALTARPVTLPDSCRIDIDLLPPHDARVHFDGQARFDARAGDCLRVTRSALQVRLLHPESYSYFAMLREKLHWSAVPRHT